MPVPKTPQAVFLVEHTTERQKTRCCQCGEMPIYRRVKKSTGVGRYQSSEIYCEICGVGALKKLQKAIASLITEVESYKSVSTS